MPVNKYSDDLNMSVAKDGDEAIDAMMNRARKDPNHPLHDKIKKMDEISRRAAKSLNNQIYELLCRMPEAFQDEDILNCYWNELPEKFAETMKAGGARKKQDKGRRTKSSERTKQAGLIYYEELKKCLARGESERDAKASAKDVVMTEYGIGKSQFYRWYKQWDRG